MSRAPYGIWNNENACFVRLCDIPGGERIDRIVSQAGLEWGTLESAQAAMTILEDMLNTKNLCVLPIREQDRPECQTYV